MSTLEQKPPQKGSTRNIVSLGFVSFFSGMSQEMITPILPIYLTGILGLSKEFVGFVSGLVVSVSSIFKILSGYISDKLGKRKWVIFSGYFLSAISRPLLGVLNIGAHVIGLRFADAVGKGVKDAPRDALVAESAAKRTGRAFGLHRMLDTLGSVVGPLVVFGLLSIFPPTAAGYSKIFLLTAIPGAIALFIIIFFVREMQKPKPVAAPAVAAPISGLGKDFYFLLLVIVVFSLGNSTDAFLLLRAQNLGLSIVAIPVIYAFFYLFYALLSYPIGILSDRVGKRPMIIFGWAAYALTYFGFAYASRAWQAWPLFILYGIFYAATEGSGRALTAEIVPRERHGLAFGLYNTAIAVTALPASVVAGWLWDKYSPAAAFNFGWITAVAAILLFGLYSYRINKRKAEVKK